MERLPMQTDEPTDEALCGLSAAGEAGAEEELVRRYRRLVRASARPFFLAGGDSEDLTQEGMVGLLRAIRTFEPGRGVPFRRYAALCVRSQILSAVRTAGRDKHLPLNRSFSLEFPLTGWRLFRQPQGSGGGWQEGPEADLISREERLERLEHLRTRLSRFESRVLTLYLRGCSCREIAAETRRSPKAVENAVQRIRRKTARQYHFGAFSES